MLRIDVDVDPDPYVALPTNPFMTDPDTLDEFWALGLRNPWRMALAGDSLFIADAGDRLTEEINALDLRNPGDDFGWGIAEGTTCYVSDCSGLTPPLYSYPTGPNCATVIGGAMYRGRFWFADYCEGWVRRRGRPVSDNKRPWFRLHRVRIPSNRVNQAV